MLIVGFWGVLSGMVCRGAAGQEGGGRRAEAEGGGRRQRGGLLCFVLCIGHGVLGWEMDGVFGVVACKEHLY